MKNQQSFSPSLLYSVAPENFSTLHLLDQEKVDEFDWGGSESRLDIGSLLQGVLSFLKTGVA